MRKIKKIMLGIGNTRWFNVRPWSVPPYTLGLLYAAISKNDVQVDILDANFNDMSFEDVAKNIAKNKPDIFCISSMSLEYAKNTHKMFEIAKKVDTNLITIIGGVYATTSCDIAMLDNNIDYAILGEGEERLGRLISLIREEIFDFSTFDGLAFRKENQVIINPIKNFIQDLDVLPFPAYDEINFKEYIKESNRFSNVLLPRYYPYTITSSSRGCPFHCIYCSTHAIDGRNIRFKSAGRVIEEINWLVDKYGIKEIIFLDDNLILDRTRFVKILDGIIELNNRGNDLHWKSVNLATFALDDGLLELMKKSNCYQVILPIESGNQDFLTNVLKKPLNLNKARKIINKAKELDFEIASDFIIGVPGETRSQIQDSINMAEEIDVDMVSFHIATPLPKTELYDLALKHHALVKDFSFSNFFGFSRGCIETDQFTPEELQSIRAKEWARINFATFNKRKRFARMAGISLDELENWKTKTLMHSGIFFPKES